MEKETVRVSPLAIADSVELGAKPRLRSTGAASRRANAALRPQAALMAETNAKKTVPLDPRAPVAGLVDAILTCA